MQDFTKDLTLLVTGNGTTSMRNIKSNLEDFIFGPPPVEGEDEIVRDVRILIPEFEEMGKGINTLINWGTPMGMEFEFIKGEDERHSLEIALSILTDEYKAGKETAFIMLYDPESTYVKDSTAVSDREIISEAKNYDWLTTFNLSAGLIDSFEGFEYTDDRIKREALEEAFAEQKRAKEAAAAPAKKTAAKKATTTRKRAASKAVVADDVPLTEEPQKPVQPLTNANFSTMDKALGIDKGWGPHEHKFVWADDEKGHSGSFCQCGEEEPGKSGLDKLVEKAYQREADKKATRETVRKEGDTWEETDENGFVTAYQFFNGKVQSSGSLGNTLSATIVTSKPKLEPVPVEVWQDIAKAVPSSATVTVKKEDLALLGNSIKDMAVAFSEAMKVFTQILEEN